MPEEKKKLELKENELKNVTGGNYIYNNNGSEYDVVFGLGGYYCPECEAFLAHDLDCNGSMKCPYCNKSITPVYKKQN